MIGVTMIAAHTYRADIERAGSDEVSVAVTLPPATYTELCAGGVTHEWVVVQAIHWLLARDVALPSAIDLGQLSSDEPAFAPAMQALLIEAR